MGSNMGVPQKQIANAKINITKHIGNILRLSAIYQTAAWGNTNQPDFLNQVIIIETTLNPTQTIRSILSIENKMGRMRSTKNAPRAIDIDILFFNKEIINSNELVVPHPQLQNRNFVLIPLNQLSPNLKHPVLNKTIHQLLLKCPDNLTVKKF